jgi:hypothetical protein
LSHAPFTGGGHDSGRGAARLMTGAIDGHASRALAPMPMSWTVPSDLRSPCVDRAMTACAEQLRAAGLLDGSPLDVSCPLARECWTGATPAKSAQHPRLPWVGPGYPSTGVVVVGLNAHTHAGLLDESYCVARAREQLALGRERFFGADGQSHSWFHYRAAAAAGLLISVADGTSPVIPPPGAAAGALLRSARIQLVQCSPDNGGRRSPTRAMTRRCPSAVAWPTLEILRPRLVALLGTEARSSFEAQFGVELRQVDPLVHVGDVQIANRVVPVAALRHPSSGFGKRSLEALSDLISTKRFPRSYHRPQVG